MSERRAWATWLDIAILAANDPQACGKRVAIRPILTCTDGCYVVSLGDRDVRSTDGNWTVFRDLDSAREFLHRLNVDRYQVLDEISATAVDGTACECISLSRSGLTVSCRSPKAQEHRAAA